MGASTSPQCPPPPPPPPAALIPTSAEPTAARLQLPIVTDAAPSPGAFLVELLTFNGYPFRDHWAYWVSSHSDPDIGVFMHASGNVARGFQFEIERGCRLGSGQTPTKRIRLQWVNGEYFVGVTLDGEHSRSDHVPVCGFERSAYKVPVPDQSLNTVEANVLQMATPGRKIQQRDCQTWIVESADQLFRDGIFDEHVATYLRFPPGREPCLSPSHAKLVSDRTIPVLGNVLVVRGDKKLLPPSQIKTIARFHELHSTDTSKE